MLTNALGPFLAKPTHNSMSFWFALGEPKKDFKILIQVRNENGIEVANFELTQIQDSIYGVFIGDTGPILSPQTRYFYEVVENGKPFLPENFDTSDMTFKTLSESKNTDVEFAFVSCNGIEEFKKHNGTGEEWAMWMRLLKIAQTNQNLAYLVLGGDQVYMDDTFTGKEDFKSVPDVRQAIFNVYKMYWGHVSYRKVMARLPSLLMWDDHDLIDGFGSRSEQFDKEGNELPPWPTYRKHLTDAFYELQAIRNPGQCSRLGPFSYTFQSDGLGFLVLDLRSERNFIKGQLLTDTHKIDANNMVKNVLNTNPSHMFVVSPVTAARMGTNIETYIGEISNYLWRVSRFFSKSESFSKVAIWYFLFSLFFLAPQINTHNKYGVGVAFLLALVSASALLGDMIFGTAKTEFSKWFHKWFRTTVGCILAAAGAFLLILISESSDKSAELLYENSAAAIKTFSPMFLSTILGLLFLHFHKKTKLGKKLYLGKVSYLFFAFALLMWMWAGFPDTTFHWSLVFPWLLMGLSNFIALFFFAVSVLESVGAIDTIAGLDDDVKDSWTSEANISELIWLKDLLLSIAKISKPILLAGDIHTGGLSKLILNPSNNAEPIEVPQIVSSPIGYVPMDFLVERLTSTKSITKVPKESPVIASYNLFYRTARNFVIVNVKKIDGVRTCQAFLHSEEFPHPIKLPL